MTIKVMRSPRYQPAPDWHATLRDGQGHLWTASTPGHASSGTEYTCEDYPGSKAVMREIEAVTGSVRVEEIFFTDVELEYAIPAELFAQEVTAKVVEAVDAIVGAMVAAGHESTGSPRIVIHIAQEGLPA